PELDRNTLRWLSFLADPGSSATRPSGLLQLAHLPALMEAATIHGVLPNVVRCLEITADAFDGQFEPGILASYKLELMGLAAHSLRLAHHGRRVAAALAAAELPASIIKGPVFAE